MTTVPETPRDMLRHAVATLAYRAGKALRGAPAGFETFRAAPTSRAAGEILAHMGDLFDWALTMAREKPVWKTATPQAWDLDVARFFAALRAFDDHLASSAPLAMPAHVLLQAPVADALAHTGQIGMLRRLAGSPVRGESYARATIAIGSVGIEQVPPNPKFEFD